MCQKVKSYQLIVQLCQSLCLGAMLFFIVSRVPQFPSVISFEQVLLVYSSSVHQVCIDLQSAIRDVSRSNRCSGEEVSCFTSILWQQLDDTKYSSCWVLWWTQDAIWKNVLVPPTLNNENIKFACFDVVLCYSGWFNLELVDVQAACNISYAFFLVFIMSRHIKKLDYVTWSQIAVWFPWNTAALIQVKSQCTTVINGVDRIDLIWFMCMNHWTNMAAVMMHRYTTKG